MCVLFAERAALNGEVLCERVNETAVDCTVARHNALTRQLFLFLAEVCAAMAHKHIELNEGILVEEHIQALTRCEFPLAVLLLDCLLAAAEHEMLFLLEHLLNFFLDCGHHIPPVYLSNTWSHRRVRSSFAMCFG